MEDAAPHRNGVTLRSVTGGLLLLGLGLVTGVGARPGAARDVRVLVAPYLRAQDEHAVGEVAGRAYGDPRHPSAAPVPSGGVSVMLLPYSAELEVELDGIKDHLRDSLKNYMEAAADVTAARTAYERALLTAGGGELIRGEVSDVRGLVQLAAVPVGEWLLLAWREEAHSAKTPRLRPRETKGFRDIPMSAGYSVMSYWRMRLQVRAGETTSVDFNDRNVWMTGVREDLYLMQGPSKKAEPKKRR
jgi:hypothetical protein